MEISALSYYTIPYNVPHEEMLFFFLKNKPTLPFIKNPWVYAIKKYMDRYEFELYQYHYLASRTSFPVVLDSSIPRNVNDTPYIIASYDLDKDGQLNEDIVHLYYERMHPLHYNYCCETYSYLTHTLEPSNVYGLDEMILPLEPFHEPFIQSYKTKESIVFIAKKKESYAYYFENIDFKTFIRFLNDFSYDKSFIDFCEQNYNTDYRFCVSYDVDKNTKEIIKSTLFSVYK